MNKLNEVAGKFNKTIGVDTKQGMKAYFVGLIAGATAVCIGLTLGNKYLK